MALGPLYYAAIGSGVLALLVVLAFLIYIYHRRSRIPTSRPSYSTSPFPDGTPKTTASSGGTGFLGYPPSPPNRQIDSISNDSASPSFTGTGGGRLKKANSGPYRNGSNPNPNPLSPQHRKKIPLQLDTGQEETEMVMVTYEEGLKKLGIDTPQHTIYPDPPSFNETGEIHPYAHKPSQSITPPFSSLSSRPTPTTASLLTPGKNGQNQGQGYRQYDSPLKNQYSPQDTPTHRTNIGRSDERGRFPTDSELGTTGIPSYYHYSSAGRYKLESPARTP